MAGPIYLLCALTCLGCAGLLFRGYVATRTRLLLWGSLCFLALMVNNALVFVDLVAIPQIDLFTVRNLAALLGLAIFTVGLIWEAP